MPYEILWEGKDGVRRVFSGDLVAAEVRASLAGLTGDPRWDDLRYSIADFLAVRSYRISQGELEDLAAIHYGGARINPRIVTAAVTDSDEVRAVFQRFNALRLSPFPLELFDNLAAARAWIAEMRGSNPPWPGPG